MLQDHVATLLVIAQAIAGAAGAVPDGEREALAGAKATRLAADRERFFEAIACAGEEDFTRTFLKASRGLIRERGKRGWYDLDGFGVREKDLRYYLDWFQPGRTEDVPVPALDLDRPDHPLRAIEGYARELAERGIDFVAVPVPNRLEIYADRLPGITLPEPYCGITPDYTRLLLALTDAGIEVVDLRPGFLAAREEVGPETDARLFMDTDHHWTPRGAALAAQLVAERLRAFGWYEPGPDREGEAFRIERKLGTIEKRVEREGPKRDLPLEERWELLSESMWLRPVLALPEGGAAQVRDREGPILLVGDSFASAHSEEHSDFASHLYAEVGRHLDVIQNPGGGMSVWKVVRRREDQLSGKRVVVWLFTARALTEPWSDRSPLFDD